MLIFKCFFTAREIGAIAQEMPGDGYCIMRRPGEQIFFGIVVEEWYGAFMDLLSGETLEQLEYLDEEEIRRLARPGDMETWGDGSLVSKLT